MHSLALWFGLTDPAGHWYLLWSGFAADITEFSVIGAALLFYQHRKCVSCWRFGKHRVEGTAWTTCHEHLTRGDHDKLLAEYAAKFPNQHAFLAGDRADSENLIQP